MITPATSALLRDRLLRAIGRIAGPDWRRALDALNADAIQAYGAGALLDADAEPVFAAVQDRRDRMAAAAGLHRAKARTGEAGEGRGVVTPLGALAFDRLAGLRPERTDEPAPRGPEARAPRPRLTHDERETASRRRSYLGHRLTWPATIKQDFHPAELAVIAVIVREIRAHETCALPLGTIAARARCCRRTVQTAIRWAAHRGYLAIEERAKAPHVIRIASAAIRQWVAGIRSPEVEKSKERENLKVPAKVAAGSRLADAPAGERRAPAPDSPMMQETPATGPDSPPPASPPAEPSRLDSVIAAWRGVLREPEGFPAARRRARPGPLPVLRPG